MRCPRDDSQLVEVDRQGIEIDYCPTCKGVWLDRRELDELINRSNAQIGYDAAPPRETREYRDEPPARRSGGIMGRVTEMLDDDRNRSGQRRDRDDDDRYDDDRYDDRDRSGRPRKRKKRSMLDDLFDF